MVNRDVGINKMSHRQRKSLLLDWIIDQLWALNISGFLLNETHCTSLYQSLTQSFIWLNYRVYRCVNIKIIKRCIRTPVWTGVEDYKFIVTRDEVAFQQVRTLNTPLHCWFILVSVFQWSIRRRKFSLVYSAGTFTTSVSMTSASMPSPRWMRPTPTRPTTPANTVSSASTSTFPMTPLQ